MLVCVWNSGEHDQDTRDRPNASKCSVRYEMPPRHNHACASNAREASEGQVGSVAPVQERVDPGGHIFAPCLTYAIHGLSNKQGQKRK